MANLINHGKEESHQLALIKFTKDVFQIDIISNRKSIAVNFNFSKIETNWNNPTTTETRLSVTTGLESLL